MLDDLTLSRLQAAALVLGSDVLADALVELRAARERIRDLEAQVRALEADRKKKSARDLPSSIS